MRVLLVLFILFSTISVHGQGDFDQYAKYNQALEKGKYKKAKKELEKISVDKSNTFLNLLMIGEFYGEIGELDSANYYLASAIDYFKFQPVSFAAPEFKHLKDSLYLVAISTYDKIVEDDPSSWKYMNRGIYKKDVGQNEAAILDFKKAIQLDSGVCLNHYNLAMAYRAINDIDSAIIHYDFAIKYNPEYGSSYLNKGFIYLETEAYDLAIHEFEEAIRVMNNIKGKSFCYNNIGFCYYKLGKFESSKMFILESLDMNPINSYAYKNLALLEIALGNNREACKNVDKAIELGFVNQFGDEILHIQKGKLLELTVIHFQSKQTLYHAKDCAHVLMLLRTYIMLITSSYF